MFVAACALLVLAAFLAIANIAGCVSASKEHGYSTVPLLSLLFCSGAFLLASETLGVWAFVPTLLDPATWVLAMLPFYLTYRWLFVKDA